jgi:hypothetical protein
MSILTIHFAAAVNTASNLRCFRKISLFHFPCSRKLIKFFTISTVPSVLVHCAEFIETEGIVDGIYRLSGIASNIQKLRVAFDEDRVPNLYQEKGVLQVKFKLNSLSPNRITING